MRLILILVLLVAIAAILVAAQPPARRRAWLYGMAVTGLLMGLAYLALSGRLHWLAALVAALLPFLRRLLPLLRFLPLLRGLAQQGARKTASAGGGQARGRQSAVTTEWLKMSLDHDSGSMDGECLRGQWAGRRLSDLDFAELLRLLAELQAADPESADLLCAYLAREHAQAWQARVEPEAERDADAATRAPTDHAEALSVLGLETGASEAEIIAAHRRLMQKLHPDRGGSDYLAARVNAAKDRLLDDLHQAREA